MDGTKLDRVVIIDYGMGNLFSVQRACEHVGMAAEITSDPKLVTAARAVILPGVGAFGDAMTFLREHDLDAAIQEVAAASKPLLGICLGMQLLMDESAEFGRFQGLGLIPGKVVRFFSPNDGERPLKVPQVGWNRMRVSATRSAGWDGTLLQGVPDGVFMYFVHSYHIVPGDPEVALATTCYGDACFCSALQRGNITAFQGHPERSGPLGLQVYANLATFIRQS